VDAARPAGTWHYRVVARDAANNESPPSNSVAVVIPSTPTQPSVRGFVASADTYVNAAAATGDFGSTTSLGVYGTPAVTSYLRFTVPAGPQGASLIGARLRVKTTTMGSAGSVNSARVHLAADTWSEATTRYATRPAVNASVLGTLTGPTAVNTSYWIPLDTSALASLQGSLSRCRGPVLTACGSGPGSRRPAQPAPSWSSPMTPAVRLPRWTRWIPQRPGPSWPPVTSPARRGPR
jgi:hypothetical protein